MASIGTVHRQLVRGRLVKLGALRNKYVHDIQH